MAQARTSPRRLRVARPAGLLAVAFVLAAGCLGDAPSDCEPLRDRATVESIEGRDALVRLPDGEPAVLHLSDEVFVQDGDACSRTGPEGVRVGDTLTFRIDAWATSYPMQGWPDKAVVAR